MLTSGNLTNRAMCLLMSIVLMFGMSVSTLSVEKAYAKDLAAVATIQENLDDDSDTVENKEPETYKGGFLYNTKITKIEVNGKPIYDKYNPDSIKTVSGITFNESKKTITVKGVKAKAKKDTMGYISIDGDDSITANLVGNNSYTDSKNSYGSYFIYLSSFKGKLTVNNSGTLTTSNAGVFYSYSNAVVNSGTYKGTKLTDTAMFVASNKKLAIKNKCKASYSQKNKASTYSPFAAKTCSNSWKSLKTYHSPNFTYPNGTEFRYNGCIYIAKTVVGKPDKNGVSKVKEGTILKKAGVASKSELKDVKSGFKYIGKLRKPITGKQMGLKKNAFKGVSKKYHDTSDGRSITSKDLPYACIAGDDDATFEDYCFRGLQSIAIIAANIDPNINVRHTESGYFPFLKYSNGKYSVRCKSISKKAFAGLKKGATIFVEVHEFNSSATSTAKKIAKLLKKYGLPKGVKINLYQFVTTDKYDPNRNYRAVVTS